MKKLILSLKKRNLNLIKMKLNNFIIFILVILVIVTFMINIMNSI